MFTEIYSLFYLNRKKIVPVNIINFIGPASLAM
jgi:LAGLIDADG DNA endonuclease family